MKYLICILIILLLQTSCKRTFEAPVPDLNWNLFNAPNAQPLFAQNRSKLQGIYRLQQGVETFGTNAAAKWSYTVKGNDTTHHLSFFCEQQSAYMVLEGKRVDSTILLNGYWRKAVNTETGKVRLMILPASGGTYVLNNSTGNPQQLIISGNFGTGDAEPLFPIGFTFERPLASNQNFEIIAHRGGGRTTDLLPASENTVEMIRLASRYGATGVELDVRLTSDKVPVLYHDATLNERLIQKNGLVGPIENYSFDQLNTLVRLTNGEKIPLLREALNTVVYETPLRFIWLDIKYEGPLSQVRQLQLEYMQKAAAIGRQLTIYIGIPVKEVQNNFSQLPDYRNILSINELTPEDVIAMNSAIWAPQWTAGLQKEEAERMHAAGKRVFTWTMDIPANIEDYLKNGSFDGILSNYPSAVAYYYYVGR